MTDHSESTKAEWVLTLTKRRDFLREAQHGPAIRGDDKDWTRAAKSEADALDAAIAALTAAPAASEAAINSDGIDSKLIDAASEGEDFQTQVALMVGADEEDQADILSHLREWMKRAKAPAAQVADPQPAARRVTDDPRVAELIAAGRQLAGVNALMTGEPDRDAATWHDTDSRFRAALESFAQPQSVPDEGNASVPAECAHEWVDARNQYVTSGEVCLKCHGIRPSLPRGCPNELPVDAQAGVDLRHDHDADPRSVSFRPL